MSYRPSRVAIVASDYPKWELYCPNFRGMEDGLAALGIEHQMFTCRPSFNPQAVIDYKPDLIVYGLLDMIKDHESRAILRDKLPKAKIVMWYGDLRNEVTGQVRADASELDMVFVSNNAQKEFYKEYWRAKDVAFLPLGASVMEPKVNHKFEFDFLFIGSSNTSTPFVDRAVMINQLRCDEGLTVINGPETNVELRAEVFKRMPEMYRSAKVTLDMSHFVDIDGYTSNRFWIVTASGGCALTRKFPGCEELYPVGTRAYFETYDDAVYLKNKLLSDPILRERIRAAGHAHSVNHTYDKRFNTMFSYLFD